MKALSALAFGAFALMTANFATVAPAAAGDVGVYAGSDGFAIEVRHYDRYGYHHRRCWDRWYRYHHPWKCRYRGYYPGYGHYYPGYYGHRYHRDDWRWRHHRRHHGWRDRDRHHDWRDGDRHHDWRDGDRRRDWRDD